MKRIYKAYKCAFPNLFEEFYTSEIWSDPKQYEVIHHTSQKEAVKERCQYDDMRSFWELKQNIKTRRFPEKDLFKMDRSELLKGISDKHITHLLHSLGVSINDKCPDEFYRNYSSYQNKHERCDKLVELGLMENWQKFESEVYSVTPKGVEAVKTLLLIEKKAS